eukprot:TRINITY_DN482_c0_g1_i1.p1 TRINITY_DN482_c0_g1~~TRINITY_DN482_c0_g1_i1.p1  ORF type:complete len:406 (-),score=155.09 TRINITY_DN482_c0_g1_i1:120-1235(-)
MASLTVLPKSYRKITVTKLSHNFREATQILTVELPSDFSLDGNEVLIKTLFVGINASDVNFTAGKYLPGTPPPFDAGFESVGVVVKVGDQVTKFKPGDAVMGTSYGAFSEYQQVKSGALIPIPFPSPRFLPLLASALTASISLEEVGQMKSNEVVLVTAAAGATGLFAVQLAKQSGNHVIGTVSSDSKKKVLTDLGCDRVINYKKEDVNKVLKEEYPNGVDIVYESVGGDLFEICVNNLAVRGRLIVIGSISGYQDGSSWTNQNQTSGNQNQTSGNQNQKQNQKPKTPLPMKLLAKSSSIRGFFLNHYVPQWKPHLTKLIQQVQEKKVVPVVDETNQFYGLEDVANAIDHMFQGKNIGKVYVSLEKTKSKL